LPNITTIPLEIQPNILENLLFISTSALKPYRQSTPPELQSYLLANQMAHACWFSNRRTIFNDVVKQKLPLLRERKKKAAKRFWRTRLREITICKSLVDVTQTLILFL
jgi:hypothetical protein